METSGAIAVADMDERKWWLAMGLTNAIFSG